MSIDDAQDAVDAEVTTETLAASRVFYTTSSKVTKVYAGPSTSHQLVDTLPEHSAVTIACQTPGQSVSGPYGKTTIWDRIGTGRYISDSYVYTGSDGYVTGKC
jgi:uncharacterized protein YraI